MNRKEQLKYLHSLPRTKEWRENMKKSMLKKPTGKEHHFWKGDDVGYLGIHVWIKKMLGRPNKCNNPKCKYPRVNSSGIKMLKPKRYEWANISGKYKRDITDWIRLCPSCHKRFDLGLIIIRGLAYGRARVIEKVGQIYG